MPWCGDELGCPGVNSLDRHRPTVPPESGSSQLNSRWPQLTVRAVFFLADGPARVTISPAIEGNLEYALRTRFGSR